MRLLLYFVSCFLCSSSVGLLLIHVISGSSPEAERMFLLVQSRRKDQRKVHFRERVWEAALNRSRQLQQQLGLGQARRLSKRFAKAGLRNPHTGDVFFLVQALGVLGCGAVGSLCKENTIFWMLAGAGAGFVLPDLWLTSRQRRRRERIRRSIPDMVDLLVICVGAGLGLDQALLRVGEELGLSHPQITEELERVSLERQAGTPRLEAWRSLAERTDIKELASFTNMLTETDRFGTPITKALMEFAEELRTKRRQAAEEAAAKTKVKIVFPLVLCIFPCLFIVLLAPALLSIAKTFGTMAR